jgi:hypothetical protein
MARDLPRKAGMLRLIPRALGIVTTSRDAVHTRRYCFRLAEIERSDHRHEAHLSYAA